jgi:plastocyanin
MSVAAIMVASISAVVAFVYPLGLWAPNQEIVLAQESNESSMSTAPSVATLSVPGQKEFYLFSVEIPEVDEETLGIPGDAYSLPTIVVNKGDNVTVHFYNVDPNTNERHSFTLGAPYSIDLDLAGGESSVVSFIADQEGIFQYYCKYHLPVMTGQLVVEPS